MKKEKAAPARKTSQRALPLIPFGLKAVVLAGGKGTRLLPYTTVLPKPLMPIGDRPVLEIVLAWLRNAGFHDVVISVGHLSQLIRTFFGSGEAYGLNIEYAIEDQPLGTIGPLTRIENLGDDFFVLNGDVLTDLDLRAMWAAHKRSRAVLTVATCPRQVQVDFGVLRYSGKSHRIQAFDEKPTLPYHVSMGVYVLSKRCLDLIPHDRFFGFDHLMRALLDGGAPVHAYPHSGRWLDIGRPEDFERANHEYSGAKE